MNDPKAVVAANCLLNSGVWADADEFCYTYTLLLPRDLPRYLGRDLVRNDALNGLILLRSQKLLRALCGLAS